MNLALTVLIVIFSVGFSVSMHELLNLSSIQSSILSFVVCFAAMTVKAHILRNGNYSR